MEREKTEELLRKYYDGLTSSEEEARLRELLDKTEAYGEFASDRPLLSAGTSIVPEPSAEFLKNLESVTLQGEPHRVSRRLYRYGMSVAAGIALIFGSYFVFRTANQGEPADTYEDPEMAMAEVRNILLNVSQNMNTGTGALRTINTFDRSLSRLRNLNDLEAVAEEKDNKND